MALPSLLFVRLPGQQCRGTGTSHPATDCASSAVPIMCPIKVEAWRTSTHGNVTVGRMALPRGYESGILGFEKKKARSSFEERALDETSSRVRGLPHDGVADVHPVRGLHRQHRASRSA